jgi:hypothetical protein
MVYSSMSILLLVIRKQNQGQNHTPALPALQGWGPRKKMRGIKGGRWMEWME